MTGKLQHRTLLNLDEFVWIWNASQGLPTPRLHLRMVRWLEHNGFEGNRQLLLLAFRNSGKSTIVALFCAWLLHKNANTRILILSGDFALSKKMARNIKQIIERHPATHRLKPIKSEQWASDQFTVCRAAALRDPSVLAKGVASNITGLRADVIVCDDVEVPNTCDSPSKRSELRARLSEIDFILVPGGLKLFVGTPHTRDSIYRAPSCLRNSENVPFLNDFKRLELPLVDRLGNSRWPERFPTTFIKKLKAQSGPAKFESQMMLRPRTLENARLDAEQINTYEDSLVYKETNNEAALYVRGSRLVSATCWWDPSFGSPAGGDANVIAVLFTSEDGYYWLHSVEYLQHDPERLGEVDAATQLCRRVIAFASSFYVPAITIETNGLGRFLPSLLRLEIERYSLRCAVLEKNSKIQKDLRIIDAFEPVLAAKRLWMHTSVLKTPFMSEMMEWKPGNNGPDDGLDAVAGCLSAEPVRLPKFLGYQAETRQIKNWHGAGVGIIAKSDFPV